MGVNKLVHKQLDSIYSTAKDLCTEYETKMLPMNMIEKIVGMSIMSAKGLDKVSAKFVGNYNDVLHSLIKTCGITCTNMGGTKMPLKTFKSYIDLIKNNFGNQ